MIMRKEELLNEFKEDIENYIYCNRENQPLSEIIVNAIIFGIQLKENNNNEKEIESFVKLLEFEVNKLGADWNLFGKVDRIKYLLKKIKELI